ncbi:hypothetical protein PG994_012748 [Apiospora phragmitis]|uniref:Uncharacterized protein n=1 Tax=Apiospora phragmitis TaxID=2905665 RepID=A0ABR1TD78_9PEZI
MGRGMHNTDSAEYSDARKHRSYPAKLAERLKCPPKRDVMASSGSPGRIRSFHAESKAAHLNAVGHRAFAL